MALKYRHEFKYVVSRTQAAVLRSRVRPLMELDSHVKGRESYSIRSMYFDDRQDTCFYENEDGTSPREKFRIRIYDGSPEVIRLELKRKERGKTQKLSCGLSKDQCEAVLKKGLSWEDVCGAGDPKARALLLRFFMKQETAGLRPKVIVEYEREPYVFRDGNVRVTFDSGIRSAAATEDFFGERLSARPVMPTGFLLMEVKYDEFLPDHIYRALQTGGLSAATFSKYYLCRKFNMGGRMNYGI